MSQDIGLQLRRARESLGMSIPDVARKTNIEPKYILAIEKGEWDRLPNLIYARAYVKAYGQLVGERVQMNRTSRRGPVTTPTAAHPSRSQHHRRSQQRTERSQAVGQTQSRRVIQAEVIDSDPQESVDSPQKSQQEELDSVPPSRTKKNQQPETFPSRRAKAKQSKSTVGPVSVERLDIWYTRFLVSSGVLLALGYIFFLYLKMTSTPGIPIS